MRSPGGPWLLPQWREPSMLGSDWFGFLNEEHRLASAADWNNPAWPRLWLYNLHYFDDLDAREAEARTAWHEALIARWIAENPPPGGPGWEPYCLSLRIVNWCRFSWRGWQLSEVAAQSLAVQVRALADQLEVHLLGNHLWANAKALVFAGLFFDGAEAEGWLRLGLRYLRRELSEQVLPDGGHFERAPMYHNIIAADVLELLEAIRLFPGRVPWEVEAELGRTAAAMLKWTAVMAHPDGEPSFFNDSAFGVAPALGALAGYADALGMRAPEVGGDSLVELPHSGYVRASLGPAVLLADVGEVGPDYLPGHAHADTLSCELALGGHRVLVNTGVSTYEATAERLAQRGTAAHNTVAVDGQDSSEVWSSFRVARRARIIERSVERQPGAVEIIASHDGYVRLPGRVTHGRRWRLEPTRLLVEDSLVGRPKRAVAFWHLHPAADVRSTGEGAFEGQVAGRRFRITVMGGDATLEDGCWAPEFGRTVANRHLRIEIGDCRLTTEFSW